MKHEEEGTKKQRKEKENVIEKAKKYNPEVYIPSHWVNVIKTAKKRSPKFQITEMTSDDFFSTTQLDKDIVNRKILVDGGKVEWLKTSWIRIEKGQPRFLKMKLSHDDDDVPFSTLDLNRRVRGKRTYFENISLPLLFPKGRALTHEKLRDLLDLSAIFHLSIMNFIETLKVTTLKIFPFRNINKIHYEHIS